MIFADYYLLIVWLFGCLCLVVDCVLLCAGCLFSIVVTAVFVVVAAFLVVDCWLLSFCRLLFIVCYVLLVGLCLFGRLFG